MSEDNNSALIIVDIQNDFIEGGALGVEGGQKVAENVGALLRLGYFDNYDYIIATKDWHVDPGDHWSDTPDYVNSWPKHCASHSHGSAHPDVVGYALARKSNVKTFYKGENSAAYSGFEGVASTGRTDLESYLANRHNVGLESYLSELHVSKIGVVGLATDHCVRATVKDAVDLGFEVTVYDNLIAGVDKERSDKTLEDFLSWGVTLTQSDDVPKSYSLNTSSYPVGILREDIPLSFIREPELPTTPGWYVVHHRDYVDRVYRCDGEFWIEAGPRGGGSFGDWGGRGTEIYRYMEEANRHGWLKLLRTLEDFYTENPAQASRSWVGPIEYKD